MLAKDLQLTLLTCIFPENQRDKVHKSNVNQNNPFKFSDDNKRYHTLYYYNKYHLGKSRKVILNAGMTCPNKDGTAGVGGCIFCDQGSGYFELSSKICIRDQIIAERERIYKKTPGVKLTGYFQSNTNTYCSAERLTEILSEAYESGLLDSLDIATRPDCLDDEKVEILKTFSEKIPLTVELGLQTVNDETARIINRGYDFDVFVKSFEKLKQATIRTCVHLIDGLPNENADDMINSAKVLGQMRPDAVKIHLLFVIKNTKLADMYECGDYEPMSFEDYINTLITQLEYLPEETVIERVTGDGDKRTLLAPMWSTDKIRVLGTIDKLMAERNTWQGRLFVAR